MSKQKQQREAAITPEAFVLLAIDRLRKPGYKGIHVVFSGFNEAFKLRYPNLNSRDVTDAMVKAGTLVVIPATRGVMLYRPEDAPARANSEARARSTLATILGEEKAS
jgi:hypothetical protein